jgi:hypothetical protein
MMDLRVQGRAGVTGIMGMGGCGGRGRVGVSFSAILKEMGNDGGRVGREWLVQAGIW